MVRRSAREWAALIREFERSGESAASFARKRGIRKETFTWWRWHLSRGSSGAGLAPKRERAARVQLVAVEPVPDRERPDVSEHGALAWEVIAPSGHVLRVYQRDSLDVLRAALSVVARGRRRG